MNTRTRCGRPPGRTRTAPTSRRAGSPSNRSRNWSPNWFPRSSRAPLRGAPRRGDRQPGQPPGARQPGLPPAPTAGAGLPLGPREPPGRTGNCDDRAPARPPHDPVPAWRRQIATVRRRGRRRGGRVRDRIGAVRHRAILAPALVLLLLLAVLLAVLWAAVIRPRLNQVDQAVARTAAVTAQALAPAQQQLNNSPQALQSRTVAAQAKAKGTAAGGGAGPTTGEPAPAPIPGGNSALNPAAGPALVAVSFRAAATVTKVGSTTQTRNLPVPAIPADGVLRISGITFDAAGGDKGTLQIERGGQSPTVLLSLDLATLDNLSYQFDQPLEFTSTQPLVVTVTCQACQPSVLFSGQGTASHRPAHQRPPHRPRPPRRPRPLHPRRPRRRSRAPRRPRRSSRSHKSPRLVPPRTAPARKPTVDTDQAGRPSRPAANSKRSTDTEYEACPGKPLSVPTQVTETQVAALAPRPASSPSRREPQLTVRQVLNLTPRQLQSGRRVEFAVQDESAEFPVLLPGSPVENLWHADASAVTGGEVGRGYRDGADVPPGQHEVAGAVVEVDVGPARQRRARGSVATARAGRPGRGRGSR